MKELVEKTWISILGLGVYESVKHNIDKYGWIDFDNLPDENFQLIRSQLYSNSPDFYRPKALNGLESNNGWREINSKADLPTDDILYYGGIFQNGTFVRLGWVLKLPEVETSFNMGLINRFQKITVPGPSLY